MVRWIETREELEAVLEAAEGFVYNAFPSRKAEDSPLHTAACRQLVAMLKVEPGPLKIKKVWSDSLRELVGWLQGAGMPFSICKSEPELGTAAGLEPTLPRDTAPGPTLAIRQPGDPTTPLQAHVHAAVRAILTRYERGELEILTEADLQGHLFAEIAGRVPGRPVPIHSHYSLVSRREKLDILVSDGEERIMLELKVEPDYPGVPKPVVFPEEVWKDLERLERYVSVGHVQAGYFLMLDENGSHYRRTETAGCWMMQEGRTKQVGWLWVESIGQVADSQSRTSSLSSPSRTPKSPA